MKPSISESIIRAQGSLNQRNTIIKDGHWYGIRSIFPLEKWEKAKVRNQIYEVIAEDDCGNDYFRDEIGIVYFRDHETDDLTKISDSIFDFLDSLVPAPDVKLKPGQVTRVWINPNFKPKFK